jgi:hypothetical protein
MIFFCQISHEGREERRRKAYRSDSTVEKAGSHHRGCTIGRNSGCSSYVALAVDVAVVALMAVE